MPRRRTQTGRDERQRNRSSESSRRAENVNNVPDRNNANSLIDILTDSFKVAVNLVLVEY